MQSEHTKRQSGHWFTGEYIRMCRCGVDRTPPKGTLAVFTDGRKKWAHCDECGRMWDVTDIKIPF